MKSEGGRTSSRRDRAVDEKTGTTSQRYVQRYRVRPSAADAEIHEADFPHYILFDPNGPKAPGLVVFLPGTGGKPTQADILLKSVVHLGYRAIGLSYSSLPAVVDLCRDSPDEGCYDNIRGDRAFGWGGTSSSDAIVGRLLSLLVHLHRRYPLEGWDFYCTKREVLWKNIILSGLSQGAGMAAYIAKHRRVKRVVLFSGPADFVEKTKSVAKWTAGESATPNARWYAAVHRRENRYSDIMDAYRSLKIPSGHIALLDLTPPPRDGATRDRFHTTTTRLEGYLDVWKTMFGSQIRRDGVDLR
jgi:acetyl esterase/lipase